MSRAAAVRAVVAPLLIAGVAASCLSLASRRHEVFVTSVAGAFPAGASSFHIVAASADTIAARTPRAIEIVRDGLIQSGLREALPGEAPDLVLAVGVSRGAAIRQRELRFVPQDYTTPATRRITYSPRTGTLDTMYVPASTQPAGQRAVCQTFIDYPKSLDLKAYGAGRGATTPLWTIRVSVVDGNQDPAAVVPLLARVAVRQLTERVPGASHVMVDESGRTLKTRKPPDRRGSC